MMQSRPQYLLDTSIQTKRILSHKWREAGHDTLWGRISPVTCMYSFMEFKNSIVGALRYLVDVLAEVASRQSDEDVVRVRLEEVIQALNMDTTIREGDRRIRMASAYAARVLAECESYPRARPVNEVIEQIRYEAEDLETVWFWYYQLDGRQEKMEVLDEIKCHLAHSLSPMAKGRSGYTCRKGEEPCQILHFLKMDEVRYLVEAVALRKVKVRSLRLRDGADKLYADITSNTSIPTGGRSIGQRLCFPIGDCIIVSKAHRNAIGLVTADRDQISLATHVHIDHMFYNGNENILL